MNSVNTNRLDREGFKVLFDLHTQSVKSKLIDYFEDIQKHYKNMESVVSRDLLVAEVKELIYESRNNLDIFKVEGISDINEFLESNLPSDTLDKLIREAINIVLSSSGSDEQRKRTIEYIKRTQLGLMKEINTKIMDNI